MNETMPNMPGKPAAPTGRGLTPREYAASLRRSFNPDFIREAKKEYERRRRMQADGTTVGGEHHDA
ncbi:hypothetical protein [Bifidobacterium pseudolongum]|uniref:hypothetical protein n=1 Tax=Bifidobacterium pseudolongum TaxID=1694 RepID=UPI0011783D94|nr:hypothetical protein [Bifidobacterium pseudolongum]